MTSVNEVVKNTVDSARAQLDLIEKKVVGFVDRVKPAMLFATRRELRQLSEKIDRLAAKVEKLARAKVRA